LTEGASLLRGLGEVLAARREDLVEVWAEAIRSEASVSRAEARELSRCETEILLGALSRGTTPGPREAATSDEGPRTPSLRLRAAAARTLPRACFPLIEAGMKGKRTGALLAIQELAIEGLASLFPTVEDEWARRLADAQDAAARAREQAYEAARTTEALRRSERRSQHRAEQLALLSSVVHRIARILDSERLMQEAATVIQIRMDHTYVAVVLRDEEGALVGRWAGRPHVARDSAGRAKGPPRGIIGRALRKSAPQVVPDVERDPDYVADVPGTRSEMVVPLIEEGRAVGALDFQSEKQAAFDLDDVVAAEVLAEFLVVALRNARLFAAQPSGGSTPAGPGA
jgi:GAF domain-containing protein